MPPLNGVGDCEAMKSSSGKATGVPRCYHRHGAVFWHVRLHVVHRQHIVGSHQQQLLLRWSSSMYLEAIKIQCFVQRAGRTLSNGHPDRAGMLAKTPQRAWLFPRVLSRGMRRGYSKSLMLCIACNGIAARSISPFTRLHARERLCD